MQIDNQRLKKVISEYGIILLILIGYYFLNTIFHLKVVCLFNFFTGYLCPGCGITRYFIAMLHGDLVSAFYYNQFVFIVFPLFLIYMIYCKVCYVINYDNYYKIPNIVYIFLLISLIMFGIIRNII